MSKKKTEQSHTDASTDTTKKVVDITSSKGDDSGFLSGLGLDFGDAPVATPDRKEKTSSAPDVTEKDDSPSTPSPSKKASASSPQSVSDRRGSDDEAPEKVSRDEFVPSEEFRQAKVVSRASSGSRDVDDLIAKKAAEASSEKAFRQSRGPSASPRFSGARRPSGGRGARSSKGRGQHRRGGAGKAQVVLGKTTSGTFKQALMQTASSKEKTYKVSDSLKKKESISLGERVTVKEFAEKMGVPLPEVMKVLLANKIVVAAHASIDFDVATLVASEFEVQVEKESAHADVTDVLSGNLQAILDQDKEAADLIARPPVITIMGHVDHGKTKLLDYLRKTNILGQEAGGITQSIGASQVYHNDQKLTFIDTPGHELFSSLRARGARITNIVVIVVAADDGVKQQTIEAINHAKDSGVPIIVAITKIDKGVQKMDEIKGQLAEHGLVPEDWGGDVMVIPLSAMTGQGVDDLLDAILLQNEMLELQYSPSRHAVAVVVEANMDAKQGVTTSMIVMTGTLRVGDVIVVHNTYGKVKRMMNRQGEQIKEASGGDPVMILGIQDVSEPGRVAEVVSSEKEANKRVALLQDIDQSSQKDATYNLMEKISQGDSVQVKLIIKADSFGSLESIKAASLKVPLPENVEVKIIHTDVSSITNSDLTLAQASDAIVIGYNVTTSADLQKKADSMSVQVKQYDIIYEYMEWLEQLASGLIEVEKEEVLIGRLEVLGVFFRRAKEMIIGGKVASGYIKNGATFKVRRGDEQISSGHITSLQKDQESVSEIKEGHECGMKIKVGKKIEVGDELQFFILQ